jgi:hypothetical protein
MKYPHWEYYLTLVEDLDRLSRFVDLSVDNYSTYSTEMTRMLLAAGSEVDVVAKLLCKNVDPSANARNIAEYGAVILKRFPKISEVEVTLHKQSISFQPWIGWTVDARPGWWKSYNDVKHQRSSHFRDASLQNVLFAIGGLCVLVCYLYHDDLVRSGVKRPSLFLDLKYRKDGKIVVLSGSELPDFASA